MLNIRDPDNIVKSYELEAPPVIIEMKNITPLALFFSFVILFIFIVVYYNYEEKKKYNKNISLHMLDYHMDTVSS